MAATALADKPKSSEQTAAETKWFVRDNCFPKDKQADPKFTRTHDIDDTLYTFRFNERRQIPVRHAMKFLAAAGDGSRPAFTVWDDSGKLVQPLRAMTGGSLAKDLKPHETVATYAELSTDALVARCRRMPNGAAFHTKSPRAVMIDFIMSGGLPPMQKVSADDNLDMSEGSPDGDDTLDNDDAEDGDPNLADGILSQD